MDEAEFDKFADEYREIHEDNIRLSGEGPDYFAEYKVAEVAKRSMALSSSKCMRILDFGAGVGTSLPYFAEYFPDHHVTCLDVSSKSLKIGRGRFPDQADFVKFDGRNVPFPDSHFSIVFAACVFHHIDHREHKALLTELRRVLIPSGIAMIFEHNPWNPLTQYVVNTCPFDDDAVLLSASALKGRVAAAGFEFVSSRYQLFFPRFLSALRPLEAFLGWLPFGAQYYVYAQNPRP